MGDTILEDLYGGCAVDDGEFTEWDKRRLEELQCIADEMLDQALRDPRLARWEQMLYWFGITAFLSIFFVPQGRVGIHWAVILFAVGALGAFVILFYILYWKRQILSRVEEEFFELHGVEYRELSARLARDQNRF